MSAVDDLVLSGQDLEEQLEKQLEFLSLVHPFLKEQEYHTECAEIRAIYRTSSLVKSVNLWRIDERGIEYYKRFLQNVNGKPVCLYYSVFAFNPKKECYKEDGTRYPQKCVNKENAEYTQILVMDFDKITEEEFRKYQEIFREIDIETIDIFTGHGYQSIILLSHRVYNKNILKDFTNLLIRKGFPVDESIIDSARIMRMPYSFNCKAYDVKSNYYSDNPQPIKTEIVNITRRRYNVDDIFFLIESLPDKEADKPQTYPNPDPNFDFQPQLPQHEKAFKARINAPDDWNIGETYPQLKGREGELPQAVKNMLYKTRENYRNKVLLFIIPFLRNHLRLPVSQIKDTLAIWATRCMPALDTNFVRQEVERLLKYPFNKDYGKYDESMREEFGPLHIIPKDEEKDQYILNSGKMIISNYIFSLYSSLSDGTVKLYFILKTQEHLSAKKEWTREEIMEFAGISRASFHRYIQELIKAKLVQKNEGNKRKKEKNIYSLCKTVFPHLGYTVFDVGTIENMLYNSCKRLTDGEFKLFTYIYHKAAIANGETGLSQDEIANAIGKKRNSISEMTDRLYEKQYIIKETFLGENNKYYSRYIINYGYFYKPSLLN